MEMNSSKRCGKKRCSCGSEPYKTKGPVLSVFYEDDNFYSVGDDCDIYGIIYKMQHQFQEYEPLDSSLTYQVVKRARKEIKDLSLQPRTTPAKFELDEISVGPLLGSGGFSNVFEISSFHPNQNREYTEEEKTLRSELIARGKKKNKFRMNPYALKHLRRKLVNKKKKFANGAIDLAVEAAFLSSLDHPNILKIHGISAEGPAGYHKGGRHDSFFIIVDRLAETLQDRIVAWRKQHKRLNSTWGRLADKKGRRLELLLADRLNAAFDIASALHYLHCRYLVYRDLKPSNIGFGLDGKLKLFDFGLCRELPPGADRCMDSTYDMSGGVGTYRYMSPEVARKEPYNQGADVFSFGVVLHELLSMNQPTVEEGATTVNAETLQLCVCWPESVKHVLYRTWAPNISQRPTMQEVCIILKRIISELRGGDATGLQVATYRRDGSKIEGMGSVNKRFASLKLDDATVATSATSLSASLSSRGLSVPSIKTNSANELR